VAPPPRVAPRGLAGIFDDYTPDAVLDTRSLPHNAVLLNVYDVSDSDLIQRINVVATANNSVLVGGVFHGGVEIYGREWSFGATEEPRTGISPVWPRAHPQHTYRATVHMGNTPLSQAEVHAVLVRLAPQWLGDSYSLIHRNCLTFCNAFLQELGLRRIPGWVDRAARAASQVDRAVRLARTLHADEVQSQAASALQSLRRESSSALDVARTESARLAEQAQSEVQREVAQVQAKALEIGGKAQEGVQAIGATLWKWGQDLGSNDRVQRPSLDPAAIIDPASLEKVRDVTGKAQEQVEALGSTLWQWGQNLQKDASLVFAAGMPEGAPKRGGHRRRRGARPGGRSLAGHRRAAAGKQGAVGESAAGAEGGEPGGVGLIRAREERLLRTSLLAGSDEEDDGPSLPVVRLPPAAPAHGKPPKQLPIVEAPVEWMSPQSLPAVTPGAAPPAAAAPAPGSGGAAAGRPAGDLFDDDPLDLMGPLPGARPQARGSACQPSPPPEAAAVKEHPEAQGPGDAVDLFDLLSGGPPSASPPAAVLGPAGVREAPPSPLQEELVPPAASTGPPASMQPVALDLLA